MNIADIPKPYTAIKKRWSSMFGRGGRYAIYYFDSQVEELINLHGSEVKVIVDLMNVAYRLGVIDTMKKDTQ